MTRHWIRGLFRAPAQPSRRPRFVPVVAELEGRAVPATFYVDPGATAGTPVFDAGRPGQFTGTFGTDVFSDLTAAINKANATPNAGGQPDVIRVATSTTPVFVPSAVDTPVAITESVNVVGDGAGASTVQTDPGNNQPTAVLVVQGAGVAANFSGLTFYGGASGFDLTNANGDVAAPGSKTGRFIRYTAGTSGTVDRSVFTGIYADLFGGIGVAVVGPSTQVTVQNTAFFNMGRIGVAAGAGAALTLLGNTYTGKGAGPFLDYFAQVSGGATAVISGNRVTGNQGIAFDGSNSAGILVARGGVAPASAQVFGNEISGNLYGIVLGDTPGADTSTADVQYNNIRDNFVGVGTNRVALPKVNAPNNWWGDPSGPFNPTTNPAGKGNEVASDVAFAPVRTQPAPVVAAPTLAAYTAAAITPSVTVTRVSDAAEPGTAGAFRFTRAGVDVNAALTVSYTVGGTATPGQDYTALSGTAVIPAGQASVDVPVTPVDDQLVEGAETVVVTPTAGAGYTTTGTPAQLTIADNDATPVVTAAGTADAAAPSTPGAFTVTRTGSTAQPLTVSYTVGGTAVPNTDYAALPGSVTIPAGQAAATVPVTPLSSATGTKTVTLTVSAGPGFTGTGTPAAVTVTGVPPPPPPPGTVAPPGPVVASGPADGSAVVFTQGAGGALSAGAAVTPFPGAAASVRAATGDVDGDGVPDLAFVTGPGVAARFTVISGADNRTVLVPQTDPFGGNFTGGGFIAVADFDGDGRAEVVLTPDQGGGPNVVIYSLAADGTLAAPRAFFALSNPAFRGGARVAAGDVNKDGVPDLAVGAGFLGGPNVEIHSGAAVGAGDYATLIGGQFFAFPGSDASTLRNGVFLAIGDVNGDGFGDLIAAGGPGGGPRVQVLDGSLLAAGNVFGAYAAPLGNFFFGSGADRGGVRVAAKDLDGDGKADIVVGSGEGLPARARAYFGRAVSPAGGEPSAFEDLSVFGQQTLPGGVFVG